MVPSRRISTRRLHSSHLWPSLSRDRHVGERDVHAAGPRCMETQRPTTAQHQSPVLEQPPTPESVLTGSALSAEATTPGGSSWRPLRPRFGAWRCSARRKHHPLRDPPCSIGTRRTPQRCDSHPPSWEPGTKAPAAHCFRRAGSSAADRPRLIIRQTRHAPRRFIDDNILVRLCMAVASPPRDEKRHVQRAIGAPIEIR